MDQFSGGKMEIPNSRFIAGAIPQSTLCEANLQALSRGNALVCRHEIKVSIIPLKTESIISYSLGYCLHQMEHRRTPLYSSLMFRGSSCSSNFKSRIYGSFSFTKKRPHPHGKEPPFFICLSFAGYSLFLFISRSTSSAYWASLVKLLFFHHAQAAEPIVASNVTV